jgi:prepilin-type N-terminal cleavage/methylation domain-containing protein
MNEYSNTEKDRGFTLIELLIAIVVVGILSAVAIVGIGSLVNTGKGAACSASTDAAKAASAVYFANHNGATPADLAALTTDAPTPELNLATGVTVVANVMSHGTDWSVTYTPATNSFTACPA